MSCQGMKKMIISQPVGLTLLVITLCIAGYGVNNKLNAEENKNERSLSMPKQYVFFYMMKEDIKKDVNEIEEIVEEHVKYRHDSKPENYSGGPFSDRSGGMILFDADSVNTAEKLAMNDPFVLSDLIKIKWIKEWQIQ